MQISQSILNMFRFIKFKLILNPATHGGGGSCRPLPALVSCPLLKISLVNPYLKILDLAKLFVANAPIKQKYKKKQFYPDHFKIWVQKPPMDCGVKIVCYFDFPVQLGLCSNKCFLFSHLGGGKSTYQCKEVSQFQVFRT